MILRLLMNLFFFFLMLRRPPFATLFPTRRSSDLTSHAPALGYTLESPWRTSAPIARPNPLRAGRVRSEEHTSELQSHSDLVCRLLLEKKNCFERLVFSIIDATRAVESGRKSVSAG